MNSNLLVNILSKFDINTKIFCVSINNQIKRKFGKEFWVIPICYLFFFILDVIRIFFFAKENPEKYGGIGYYGCGDKIWFMVDLTALIFCIGNLFLLCLYYLDNNEWLININEFYNEIRDKELDLILTQFSHRLFISYKRLLLFLIIFCQFIICAVWFLKFDLIYKYPVSFLLSFIYVTFHNIFGVKLNLRIFFISFFLSHNYILLFKNLNQTFSQINIEEDQEQIMNLLVIHNKLSDSVLEMNKFLRPIYVVLVGLWSPLICYLIFVILYSDINGHVKILVFLVVLNFSVLVLTLSSLIALIDIECDRSLHLIHGFALNIKDRQQIFQVLNLQ